MCSAEMLIMNWNIDCQLVPLLCSDKLPISKQLHGSTEDQQERVPIKLVCSTLICFSSASGELIWDRCYVPSVEDIGTVLNGLRARLGARGRHHAQLVPRGVRLLFRRV